jgi:hypothetical protein
MLALAPTTIRSAGRKVRLRDEEPALERLADVVLVNNCRGEERRCSKPAALLVD